MLKSLFQITDETRQLAATVEAFTESGDINDPELAAQLDEYLLTNDTEFTAKADNYAAWMAEKEALGEARIAEAKRLMALGNADKAVAAKAKERLKLCMETMGRLKFESSRFKFGIVGNGGKAPLILAEDFTPPAGYFRTIIEPEKELIRAAIENGIQIPGAVVAARGTRLAIK